MAKKGSAGLLVAGLAVLFFGFILLAFAIESEQEAETLCEDANVGDEAGNETCDNSDQRLIGLQSTIFILAVFIIAVALIVLGIRGMVS